MNKNSGARTAGDGDVLMIVDVQYDFCPSGAIAVPDGEAVIPMINRLAAQIAHVVLTQDWHPPGHTSLARSQARQAAI
jgi:nicotinamidase/pyrazinamidase